MVTADSPVILLSQSLTSCSIWGSNCCFLTRIQVSQETDNVVWCSHLFKNFAQFAVNHTVQGFLTVNEAEVDFFLESPCFFYGPTNVGNLVLIIICFHK